MNWLWNDGAKYMGRVTFFAAMLRVLFEASGFDVDAWLASIGI